MAGVRRKNGSVSRRLGWPAKDKVPFSCAEAHPLQLLPIWRTHILRSLDDRLYAHAVGVDLLMKHRGRVFQMARNAVRQGGGLLRRALFVDRLKA